MNRFTGWLFKPYFNVCEATTLSAFSIAAVLMPDIWWVSLIFAATLVALLTFFGYITYKMKFIR